MLNDLLHKFLAKNKEVKMRVLSGDDIPVIKKVPTGVFVFDYLTMGGIPLGRVCEFVGQYSSGKTTMSFIVANKFMQIFKDAEVVFIDFEQSISKQWVEVFIKDKSRFKVVVPPYGEAGLDMVLYLLDNNADVSLYIIDSLSAIVPAVEDASGIEDMQIGLQARLLSKFFRKLLASKTRCEKDPTILLLNQVRTKIGQRAFAPVSTPSGGSAHEFYASMIVRFYNKGVEDKDGLSLQTVQLTVEKNKTGGIPKISGEFQLCLSTHGSFTVGDIYEIPALMKMGRDSGFIAKEKVYKILGKEFKSLADIETYLKENRDFRIKFTADLLAYLLT